MLEINQQHVVTSPLYTIIIILLLLLIYLPGPESGIRGLQNRLVEDIYKQTLNKETHQLVDINHSHYLYLQRKEII